jgi:hypothetical protein
MAFISNQQTNPNDPQANQAPSAQPSVTAPNLAQTSSPAANTPQQKGSGRFTNIQKYISANQGAGERLASGVGKKIESQINPQATQAQQQAQSVREGIQSAEGQLQQGQQLRSQAEQQNFDATGFAANQENLNKFTQFRTGQGIDEKALQQSAIANQQNALAAQQAAQGFGQQLGTEQGRQQLLKQTFSPTKNYSTGQQRLDNLFLSQANPQLQGIQGNLNTTSQNLGTLINENQVKQQKIQDLTNQEQELSQGLSKAIQDRDVELEQQLTQRIGEVNAQRDLERKKYTDFTDSLLKSGQGQKIETPLDESLISEAGLNLGQQTFNVFKNPALASNELLNLSTRQAQGIQDVAQQSDVDRYRALAALGGIEPSKLTQAGQLERAAGFRTGEGSIQNRIQDAKMKFLEDAIKQNLVGSGAQNWKSKDTFRGKKGTETASATLNLADVLGGDYQTAINNASASKAGTLAQQSFQNDLGDFSNNLGAIPIGIVNAPGAFLGGTLSAVANALPSIFGGDPNAGKQSRARTAAQSQANQDVMNKLNAYLQQSGFDQYLGSQGIASGTTKLEDYGYGATTDKTNQGRFNMLKKLPGVE